MVSKKTSSKRKKSPKKFTPKKIKAGGMIFETYSPTHALGSMSAEELGLALGQALVENDKEAFQEILSGFVRAHNILEVSTKTKVSRTLIYEAIDKDKNPRLDSVFKIIAAFKEQLSA